jgi:hypothetical protein
MRQQALACAAALSRALSDSGRTALPLWKAHLPAATAEALPVAAAS